MPLKTGFAVILTVLAVSEPALADCVTQHFRFFTRDDTVTTSEILSGGETCFHTLRNNARAGNVFYRVAVAEGPSHGRLTVGGSAFQYRSSAGYTGSDSYAVKICMAGPRGHGCSIVAFNASIR